MPTHFKGTDRERRTLNAFIKLTRAAETINARLSRKLAEENLTVSQLGILEALLHIGPQNQRELGSKILKSGGNITLVIDNLEKRGFVIRETDPNDRRAMIIKLTKEGDTFISDYFPRHLENIMYEFEPLDDKELEELGSLCKKVGLKE